MKAVEASAATREQAIQQALEELGVEMFEVDKIEILDEGSKGIFGFGARPVKVKVIVEHLANAKPLRAPQRGRAEQGEAPKRQEAEAPEGQRGEQRRGGGRNQRRDNERGPRTERGGGNQPKQRPPRREPKAEQGNRDNASRPPQNRKPAPQERTPATEANSPPPQRRERASVPEEATFEPISEAQGSEAAAILQEIITKMGIEAKTVFTHGEDGSARLDVTSEDGAILIGRKGRTLGALQYLINRMVSQSDAAENTERIVVDVEGYVDRRRSTLEELARNMADKAKQTQRNMRLKPLSPQERRIIHVTLQDDTDIRTFSTGESLYRSVVISPKNARPPRSRSGRGRGDRGGGRQEAEIDPGQFGD